MVNNGRTFLVKEGKYNTIVTESNYYRDIVEIYLIIDKDYTLRIRIDNNINAIIQYVKSDNVILEYRFPLEEANRLLYSKEYLSIKEYRVYYFADWLVYELKNKILVAKYDTLTPTKYTLDYKPEPIKLPDWIGKEITGSEVYLEYEKLW